MATYYIVGKLLIEVQGEKERAKYGNGLIKEYSQKLTIELNKNYSERNLRNMRQFYVYCETGIWNPMGSKLSWTHYRTLLKMTNAEEIQYYIKICEEQLLSKRDLEYTIKSKEYEKLDDKTKNKLVLKENMRVEDYIKNPIIINNPSNIELYSEKLLNQLILENKKEGSILPTDETSFCN